MEQAKEIKGVRIVKIISETKKARGQRPPHGWKRVMAVVSIRGQLFTRHVNTRDGQFGIMKMYH